MGESVGPGAGRQTLIHFVRQTEAQSGNNRWRMVVASHRRGSGDGDGDGDGEGEGERKSKSVSENTSKSDSENDLGCVGVRVIESESA